MSNHTLDSLNGKDFSGLVGEPWNFVSDAGENVVVGTVLGFGTAPDGERCLLCRVTPFSARGVSISSVVIASRNRERAPLTNLLQGAQVTAHILYDRLGTEISDATTFLSTMGHPFLIATVVIGTSLLEHAQLVERRVVLADKLLSALHLSVEDRRSFENDTVPLNSLVRAVHRAMETSSTFPRGKRLEDLLDGVFIESKSDGYLVHERHEVGLGRHSTLVSRQVRNLSEALRFFVAHYGDRIDGLRVDLDH